MKTPLSPFQLTITWVATMLTLGQFPTGYRMIIGATLFAVDMVYAGQVAIRQSNYIHQENKKAKDKAEQQLYERLHKKYAKK